MEGAEKLVEHKEKDWLSGILSSNFFGSCAKHQYQKENMFCLDCNLVYCNSCVWREGHFLHRQLQIYKHGEGNHVVRVQDVENYFDCSRIQTLKSNREKTVRLYQRPQDATTSTKGKFWKSCKGCERQSYGVPSRFCSIACKASADSLKSKDESETMIAPSIQEIPGLNSNPERQSTDENATSSHENVAAIDISNDTPSTTTTTNRSSRKGKEPLNDRIYFDAP